MEGLDLEVYFDVLGTDNGHLDELKARLASGLDPNHRFTRGGKIQETILESVLWRCHADCVQAILEAKADVNVPCYHRDSRHTLSLLNCCRDNKTKANLLIRHGLKLTRLEQNLATLSPWPKMERGFFKNRDAYLVLQTRKARCRQVCAILLHRRNLRWMPLDLRRDWIKRMVWSTHFDFCWSERGEVLAREFEVDASVPVVRQPVNIFRLFGWDM